MKHRLLSLLFLLLIGQYAHGESSHYTVVISLDGYRWDYPQWYDTPFMDSLEAHGVASGLIPSYPSKTFPNHITMATGLYPDHHGIIANTFYDPQKDLYFSLKNKEQKTNPAFYGGEPIWVTAQKQGLRTTVLYWAGSDVKLCGRYPDRYWSYETKPRMSNGARLQAVIDELKRPESERPHLIMAYLDQPDASGHLFGPQSKHTRKVVERIDSMLTDMHAGLKQLPIAGRINLLIVSDHGMTWVAKDHVITFKERLKDAWIKMIDGNVPANIYVNAGCRDSVYHALQGLPHAQVWKKETVPAYLHFGSNPHVGDIVVNPDLGYYISETPIDAGGTHGYDPQLQDMHAIFRATGPDFCTGSLPHFPNVDLYPLLCRLLRIQPTPNDGKVPDGMLAPQAGFGH